MRRPGYNPSIHVANVIGDALHDINPVNAAEEAVSRVRSTSLQDRVTLPPKRIASAHERHCAAHHESGHAMAALEGNAAVISVKIRTDGTGLCSASEIADPEAQIIFALAGAFAQIKFSPRAIHECTNPPCSDFLVARVCIDDLNASRMWPHLTYRTAAKTAMRFVETHWGGIQDLALALNDAGDLDDMAIRIFSRCRS